MRRNAGSGRRDRQLVRFRKGVTDNSYFLAMAFKPEVWRVHGARFSTTSMRECSRSMGLQGSMQLSVAAISRAPELSLQGHDCLASSEE
jgi:hypothetical protein